MEHWAAVSEGEWGGLKYCPTCHLIWPCLEGRILAYARRGAWQNLHVAEIRARLENEAPRKQRKKSPLREVCKRGHPLKGANVLTEASGTIRRCLMCRADSLHARLRRHHKPQPSETGVCKKGLHAWVPDNIVVDKRGTKRCRTCREIGSGLIYARGVVIPCMIRGCERATHGPETGRNYLCKWHREHPPAWLERVGFQIVGTRVEFK